MTGRIATCDDCGGAQDPRARFCSRCGRATAVDTPRRPAPARDRVGRTIAVGVVGLLAIVAIVAIGLAVVDDGADAPAPTAPAGRTEIPTVAPEVDDAVDIDPEGDGTRTETVGGLACQGPDGPVTCVTHLAELDLAAGDEVRVIRGRIVVAGEDGIVSAHSLRDGNRRWRASLEPPLTLHPDVAESIPVATPEALTVLDLDSGDRIGRIDGEARQVAAVGPWIVVDDGERIAAYGVTGRPGWTRELDGASALLSSSGSYVRGERSLTALFGNTGEQRFDAPITGSVGAITQQDGRVVVVTDEPPQVRYLAADGVIRSRIPLLGTQLSWAGFSPSGEHLATLTQDADGNLQWLTLIERFQANPPRHIPLSGQRSTLDPVLDDSVLLLPHRGAVGELLVIDLDSRSVINRVTTDRPLTDIGLAGDAGFATIDDLGMLRVQGVRAPAPAYTVALGADAHLLQARPLLVRTQRAVAAFQDVPAP